METSGGRIKYDTPSGPREEIYYRDGNKYYKGLLFKILSSIDKCFIFHLYLKSVGTNFENIVYA